MRVLVACEYSGKVRDAFAAKGHDVVSCDLLPSEKPGRHYTGDVLDILYDGYDFLIGFPPCTYTTSAGLHFNRTVSGRADLTRAALQFFKVLLNAPIKHICLENPVGCISTRVKVQSQIINPFQFGHVEKKRTCLWLKNLPLLRPTKLIKPADRVCFVDRIPERKDRWKIRSETFDGVAQAMADQWGDLSKIFIQQNLFYV